MVSNRQSNTLIMHATSCMKILHEVVLVKNSLTIKNGGLYHCSKLNDCLHCDMLFFFHYKTRKYMHAATPRLS